MRPRKWQWDVAWEEFNPPLILLKTEPACQKLGVLPEDGNNFKLLASKKLGSQFYNRMKLNFAICPGDQLRRLSPKTSCKECSSANIPTSAL